MMIACLPDNQEGTENKLTTLSNLLFLEMLQDSPHRLKNGTSVLHLMSFCCCHLRN